MIKSLTILLLVLTVTGCSYTIPQSQLRAAEAYCKDKEGVYSLSYSSFSGNWVVACKNGVYKKL